ncbi:hypothetical protein BO94DRAFT_324618 [Aspergillus sclerotioniger CBS 115572]|uniref:Uncharacterized protein n=1 Tax=Aspergillus sclerotioniger CBS 115572 TaxID=1450535 RepID=A0A317X7M5_9EURO|nr:hypothetical protein BO94DRAFT_324618 [Aspergillus sclerotioniger CBS 115572]PWY94201.1 hypothetical protein BO94DRAFT_324618 [Aspergillus sclerotioniger CBS 115572]
MAVSLSGAWNQCQGLAGQPARSALVGFSRSNLLPAGRCFIGPECHNAIVSVQMVIIVAHCVHHHYLSMLQPVWLAWLECLRRFLITSRKWPSPITVRAPRPPPQLSYSRGLPLVLKDARHSAACWSHHIAYTFRSICGRIFWSTSFWWFPVE